MTVFQTHHQLFHLLNGVSMALTLLLFVMFQAARQNILVRTASIVCLLIGGCMLANFWLGDLHLRSAVYCSVQAVFLNYCYISLHAHFCFLMLNNLAAVRRWRLLGIRDTRALVGLMVGLSLAVPILATIFVLAYSMVADADASDSVYTVYENIERKGLYCTVNEPALLGYRLWFMLFGGPGIVFALMLLHRTWRSRQVTLHLSRTSQIGKLQLARLMLSVIVYLMLAVASVTIGLSPAETRGRSVHVEESIPATSNPYVTPDFCDICDHDNDYYCKVLCPGIKTHLPAIIGLMMFIMYGLGSVAFASYARIYRALFGGKLRDGRDDRRDSSSSTHSGSMSFMRRRSSQNRGGRSSLSTVKEGDWMGRQSRQASQVLESLSEEFVYDLPEAAPSIAVADTVPLAAVSAERLRSSTAPTNSATVNRRLLLRRSSEPLQPSPLDSMRTRENGHSVVEQIPEAEDEAGNNHDGDDAIAR